MSQVPVQDAALVPGRLVESLTSPTSPAQRYAVYVPSSYRADRPAPLVILMDPRGRARVPADLFIPAAERFGYLLVSSYNTASDGPIEPTLDALQVMWNDMHARFAIDSRRVYLAGFSGTARLATLTALRLPGRVAGIVAAGAGYAPDLPPTRAQDFLYYGAVGDLDFNFFEMQQLEDTLADLDVPHRFTVFPGGHTWMPEAVTRQAMEWLELHAMRTGTRARDDALIDEWWQRDLAAADTLVAAGRQLDASRLLAAMRRDYAGLRETATVAAHSRELAATPAARRQARDRTAEFQRTTRFMAEAMQALADGFPPGSGSAVRTASAVSAELGLARLRKEAEATSTEAGRAARRLLTNLSTQVAFYLPQQAAADGEFARAAFYLALSTDINPTSPAAWYQLAAMEARAGERRAAVSSLDRAVDHGFRDRNRALADPAFAAIRSDEAFARVLARMGGLR
ncbi:MAG TPA: hypothetical protein VMM93_03035 [Vicinamibacterales bacterium]|nr:hypothetical protein [Vicinamibacterales bacterium]